MTLTMATVQCSGGKPWFLALTWPALMASGEQHIPSSIRFWSGKFWVQVHTLRHIPLVVTEQFPWCGSTHCPDGRTNIISVCWCKRCVCAQSARVVGVKGRSHGCQDPEFSQRIMHFNCQSFNVVSHRCAYSFFYLLDFYFRKFLQKVYYSLDV